MKGGGLPPLGRETCPKKVRIVPGPGNGGNVKARTWHFPCACVRACNQRRQRREFVLAIERQTHKWKRKNGDRSRYRSLRCCRS